MNTTRAPKSVSQICEAIALDLKARNLTHAIVAELTGKTKHTISTQISGKRRFSKEMAMVFAEKLGYNPLFLLYGEGELREPKGVHVDIATAPFDVDDLASSIAVLSSMTSIATEIIRGLGDKNAITAWSELQEGNYDGYINAMVNFQDEHEKKGVKISPVLAKVVCQHIKNSQKSGLGKTFFPLSASFDK